MIPLPQGTQPVEAAPLVIILQELDTACRGSTAPGSGPGGLGAASGQTQGSSLPRGKPSHPNTHTHIQPEPTLSLIQNMRAGYLKTQLSTNEIRNF